MSENNDNRIFVEDSFSMSRCPICNKENTFRDRKLKLKLTNSDMLATVCCNCGSVYFDTYDFHELINTEIDGVPINCCYNVKKQR